MHDIDVEGTHNFVAGGLVTHNSVYGFRGADIRNILNFEDDYPDAHVVRLEQNYRSTQTILDAANAVIAQQPRAHGQVAVDRRRRGRPDQGPRAATTSTRRRASWSARSSGSSTRASSRNEVAVFYRTNAQSRVLEDMLVRAQVGYQVIGGTKFYERAEVKDAIAYLTFLVNPQDGGAFTRIVNSPRRGIGQTSLSRVLAAREHDGRSRWEAAADPEAVPALGTRGASRRSTASCRPWSGCGSAPRPARRSASCSRRCCSETGYLDALEAERTIEAQGRIENLEELVSVGARVRRSATPRRRARPGASSCSRSRCSRTPTTCATTRASSR